MTLEILEDSVLDLGPGFWALMVLVALVVIEVFQLGPQTINGVAKKCRRKGKKQKTPANLKAVVQKGISGGIRKRHNVPSPLPTISAHLFRDCVINVHYFGEEDHALLYVGPGGEGLELNPKPEQENPKQEKPEQEKPEQVSKVRVIPSADKMDNYVIAIGENPEESVLQKLATLWSVTRDHSVSDNKYLVLFCSRLPSTYAVQQIAEALKGYTSKVGVSVLYQTMAGQEEEEEGEESVEEKMEHLKKFGISLCKIE